MALKFWVNFLKSIQSWKQNNHLCKDAKFLAVFFFFRRGRYLWTHFSQLFLDQIKTFLCLFNRKFPELYKTHPTFITFALLRAPKSIQLKILLFQGTHFRSFKWAPKNLRGIFYQMDHIWCAPHMHKKFSGAKMESQWSHTFGQSLIPTLYTQSIIKNKEETKVHL